MRSNYFFFLQSEIVNSFQSSSSHPQLNETFKFHFDETFSEYFVQRVRSFRRDLASIKAYYKHFSSETFSYFIICLMMRCIRKSNNETSGGEFEWAVKNSLHEQKNCSWTYKVAAYRKKLVCSWSLVREALKILISKKSWISSFFFLFSKSELNWKHSEGGKL